MKIRTIKLSTIIPAALLAVFILAAAPVAHAVNLTWDTTIAADSTITDGAGTWNVGTGNWNNSTTSSGINFANGDNVTFGGGSSGTAGTITIGDVHFNGAGYDILGRQAASEILAAIKSKPAIQVASAKQ